MPDDSDPQITAPLSLSHAVTKNLLLTCCMTDVPKALFTEQEERHKY